MSIEDEVLAAAGARARALADADGHALRNLLHPRFSWVSHRGEVFDRDRYVAANTASDGLRWRQQAFDDVHVVMVGTTAILRCVVTDTVTAEDGEQTFRMPMTQTWVHDGGGWRCLAGHAGPLRRTSL